MRIFSPRARRTCAISSRPRVISDVSVEYKQQQVVNGAQEITYIIERGKRHRLVYLDISGNKYFDEKTNRRADVS